MAFDEESTSSPAEERSHFVSSITKTTKRSKKTKRLGPGRVMRPEQYEAFDVNSKLECIRALIPLGLMHLHELLEEEVSTLAGMRYARKAAQFPGRRGAKQLQALQERDLSELDLVAVFLDGKTFAAVPLRFNACCSASRWLATALLDIEPRLASVNVRETVELDKPMAPGNQTLIIGFSIRDRRLPTTENSKNLSKRDPIWCVTLTHLESHLRKL